MNWSDRIFEEFKKGKIESFYRIVYPDLLVYATGMLHGEGAFRAEDYVQEAVEVSYRRRHDFESALQWRAFIFTCIRNRIISVLRHNDAKTNYIEELRPGEEMAPDALSDFIEVESRIRIYNAIATLPEELRQIFVLNFEEGLKNAEIAKRLGVAEITVKKRKSRMLSILRNLLGSDYILIFLMH